MRRVPEGDKRDQRGVLGRTDVMREHVKVYRARGKVQVALEVMWAEPMAGTGRGGEGWTARPGLCAWPE